MNLCGEKWLLRQRDLATKFGRQTFIRSTTKPMTVEGVGKGTQSCKGEAKVPICLHTQSGNRKDTHYEAQFIENSEIPALLGLDTLKRKRAVLDCYNGILYEAGDGEYKLQLPSGSTQYQLEEGASGHWLLPCRDWKKTVKFAEWGLPSPVGAKDDRCIVHSAPSQLPIGFQRSSFRQQCLTTPSNDLVSQS